MPRVVLIALVLVGAAAMQTQAQVGEPLRDDDVAAGLAAIEWYINIGGYPAQTKYVLSRMTTGDAISSDGERIRPAGRKRSIGIPPKVIERLESRLETDIAFCDAYENDSLCGIEPPWVWLVISEPTRTADGVVMVLEARTYDDPPSGRVETATTVVRVQRAGNTWQVLNLSP